MGGAAKALKKVSKIAVAPIEALNAGVASKALGAITGAGNDQNIPEAQTYTPPGVPTEDEARAASEQSDLLRRRRGRASTILTGRSGDMSTVNVGTKTLLG